MRILSVFICLLLANNCLAQQRASFRFFDSEWKPVKEKNSVYFVRQQKISGNRWQVDHYQTKGPLIKSETFSDEKSSIRNGRFTWYDVTGRIDSTGFFTNNLRDKSWYYYKKTDSMKLSKSIDYDNGKIVKVNDYSLNQPQGIDTVGKDAEESAFPGGNQGWMRYLMQVLRYPQRAMELGAQGNVQVMFIINKNGKVEDPFLYRSVELSLDEEALRVINATPPWIPARINGEKVDSYKLQPITFRVSFK